MTTTPTSSSTAPGARAVYRKWLALARPAAGELRRPIWLFRPVKPVLDAYALPQDERTAVARAAADRERPDARELAHLVDWDPAATWGALPEPGGARPVIWLAIPFGIVIGLIVGAVGGGGAILALPVLVYVLGEPVGPASTASLIVVAIAAGIGAGIARAPRTRLLATGPDVLRSRRRRIAARRRRQRRRQRARADPRVRARHADRRRRHLAARRHRPRRGRRRAARRWPTSRVSPPASSSAC